MAIYTDESEITDILIKNIKRNPIDFTAFVDAYLLRADAWYIDRANTMGVSTDDIVTYAEGQKYNVVSLLRYFVYIEALKDLFSVNAINDDDYFRKLNYFKSEFSKYNDSLTVEEIKGEDPKINKIRLTAQKITLAADLYNTSTSENYL